MIGIFVQQGTKVLSVEDQQRVGALEAVGELRVPIPNQKPELPDRVLQIGEKISGLLVSGCGGSSHR
ncbi:hypothetical protein ACIBO5_48305 [Nonomuraea angiospora]|uniref:hypothetical protein n=1 Tax=Nonomuraea angiospora TaxID=46172 RepID=UPI0029A48B2C|nr:hypothetical protein [Nonomuraea angiospora]MDX3100159.1 hypothetical protein [Nonomuraea angiospora]